MLYALYRFAEECGGYYEFSLSRLMDFTIEAEGVSPAQIFALARDEMAAAPPSSTTSISSRYSHSRATRWRNRVAHGDRFSLQIFALARDEMEALLNGLARANPDFVTFTTTQDLELVRLADDKTSTDVLKLFEEQK